MNELYLCRRAARSVEIIDAFVAPSGVERIALHLEATFSRDGQLETEVEYGVSDRDPFSRMEREFQHGHCVLETAFGRDGRIARRRRITRDAAGRAVKEVTEDARGEQRAVKTIHHHDDGGRFEELPLEMSGDAHYQIGGIHVPVRDASLLRLHYNDRSLLTQAEFVAADGSSRGEVSIEYDADGRQKRIRHYTSGGDEQPISEVRFDYDDRRRTATRTTIMLGEVVQRSTQSGSDMPPAEELEYEDLINESGDWTQRRVREGHRVIRRVIEYW